MKSTVKKLPQSQIEIKFTLDPQKLEAEREVAFNKLADEVKVPGFRPGRAPRKMIEERINPNAPMQQALDAVLNAAYQEALKEHDLVPVANPEVNIESVDYSKPIEVKAVVQVRPEAKIGDYSKIKVKKAAEEVTEAKLNETLQTIFERSTAPAGQDSHTHEEEGLVGSDGQPLKTEAKPDKQMDDAWAKTLGAKDLEDLRGQVKADLESAAKYEAEQKWQDEILEALINMTKADLPEAFIEDEIARMGATFEQQLQSMNITMQDYLAQAGKTKEDMEAQWRPQAEKQAMLEIALAEVAKQEDIQISDQEVDDELKKVDDQTKARFQDPQQRYYLMYSLWRQKIMRHIVEKIEANSK